MLRQFAKARIGKTTLGKGAKCSTRLFDPFPKCGRLYAPPQRITFIPLAILTSLVCTRKSNLTYLYIQIPSPINSDSQIKKNMNLKEHYNRLYINAVEKIKNDLYTIDPLIDSSSDNRFGITVLIRPSIDVKNKIQDFLNELKKNNPNQYYYPNSDIHITVLSIISCHEGFDLNTISIPEYNKIIQKSLEDIKSFEIHFQGITASNSAIMVQGFTKKNLLDQLRNNLRTNFKNSGLQQSIDTRYVIQTAHLTVVRFKETITDKESLLKTLKVYRTLDFGKFKVEKIELVHNDWYQRNNLVQQLHSFELK